MKKAVRLTVFLFLAMPVCAWSQGGRFKEIFIGEAISALPFNCQGVVYCQGMYQSTWVRISFTRDKVDGIEVIYWGKAFHHKAIFSSPLPTLGQAVKIHSLQPGFTKPIFGYAKDREGAVYGVVDTANRIAYHIAVPVSMGPESLVTEVAYLGETAPVLRSAEAAGLQREDNAELLEAAGKMAPYTGATVVLDEEADYKATSHEEALDKLNAQIDVVMGKGKRTLALIQQLQTWYEVDKDHPDAEAKSEELRQFYPGFQKEYEKLLRIAALNDRFWKGEEQLKLMLEPFGLQKEIESQMRRLTAMGFEL